MRSVQLSIGVLSGVKTFESWCACRSDGTRKPTDLYERGTVWDRKVDQVSAKAY